MQRSFQILSSYLEQFGKRFLNTSVLMTRQLIEPTIAYELFTTPIEINNGNTVDYVERKVLLNSKYIYIYTFYTSFVLLVYQFTTLDISHIFFYKITLV